MPSIIKTLVRGDLSVKARAEADSLGAWQQTGPERDGKDPFFPEKGGVM